VIGSGTLADALGVDLIALDGGHFLPLDSPEGVATAILQSEARVRVTHDPAFFRFMP
jgi:hypothetical protein